MSPQKPLSEGRSPPSSLPKDEIQAHFEGWRRILYEQCSIAAHQNQTDTGTARELFVKSFLGTHLPANVRIGSGYIKNDERPKGWSKQQDIIVYDASTPVLPIGNASRFYPAGIIACIEVKSQLSASVLCNEVAPNFGSLPASLRPLRVVVTYKLAGNPQSRGIIYRSKAIQDLPDQQMPDLIVPLDNGAIIRRGCLQVLGGKCDKWPDAYPHLYKYGKYTKDEKCEDEKWTGLAVLVFELIQRSSNNDWMPYFQTVLPSLVADM